MDCNQPGLAFIGELVTGVQLLAPHGADLAVDQHIAVLDLQLGGAAGGDDVRQLHGRLQLDKLGLNGDPLSGLLLFDNYFHRYSPFLQRRRQSLPPGGRWAADRRLGRGMRAEILRFLNCSFFHDLIDHFTYILELTHNIQI